MRVAETSGKTVDEAIARALSQLGLRREQVDVDVITEGSKGGFLGFGSADAIVRVTAKDSVLTSGGTRQRGGRGRGGASDIGPGHGGPGGDRSGGDRGGDRGGRTPEAARPPRGERFDRPTDREDVDAPPSREPEGDAANEDARRRRGSRGGRRRGGAGGPAGATTAPTGAGRAPAAGEGRGGGESRGGGRSRAPQSTEHVRGVPVAEQIRIPDAPDDAPDRPAGEHTDEVDLAGSTLRDLLTLLGLARTEISARDPETPGDGLGLVVQVLDIFGEDDDTSDELGLLIGRRGETLSSLQYLVNTIVAHSAEDAPVFGIDIEGYRRRREQTLVDLAREVAQEVRDSGDVITLEPMPAAERRIVHLALEQEPGVRTESVGSGDHRQVEVMPE